MAKRSKEKQLELRLPMRGGRRPGAGRKPKGRRAGVSHGCRPMVAARHPVHVTMRMRDEVWNLRTRRCFRVVEAALAAGSNRLGIRLTHFSVQGNHVHLVVEAEDARALSRGMQGLSVRVARALNRVMRRTGKVFADRFHSHVLRTAREVRNAVLYVLGNARVHARRQGRTAPAGMDAYAGGPGLEGAADASPVVHPPRTWLLRVGWQRAG